MYLHVYAYVHEEVFTTINGNHSQQFIGIEQEQTTQFVDEIAALIYWEQGAMQYILLRGGRLMTSSEETPK